MGFYEDLKFLQGVGAHESAAQAWEDWGLRFGSLPSLEKPCLKNGGDLSS
jgi:hypothetical protein